MVSVVLVVPGLSAVSVAVLGMPQAGQVQLLVQLQEALALELMTPYTLVDEEKTVN